ncbi:hypothetical protein E2C01_064878 [Portunus trituberculatus]|uniref:Uncharacterized protein n=1 Tax=Portunus trituberculatus TaxID=210409 RepID=A0A5B7HQ92_PORTR|nr:hypothetical protein [Portunus trituberculatus]
MKNWASKQEEKNESYNGHNIVLYDSLTVVNSPIHIMFLAAHLLFTHPAAIHPSPVSYRPSRHPPSCHSSISCTLPSISSPNQLSLIHLLSPITLSLPITSPPITPH